MKTYLYIKTHNITGLKYFGKTNKSDYTKYKGSGTYWVRHVNAHGNDVSTELYGVYDAKSAELVEDAVKFSIDNDIVNSVEWANIEIENGLDGRTPKYEENFIIDVCLNFNNRKEFELIYPGILHAAKNYNIIEKVTKHMVHSGRIWMIDEIISLSKLYNKKSTFVSENPGVRDAAKYLGIWSDITAHMKTTRTPKYNLVEALTEAKSYSSKTEYTNNSKMCHWVRSNGYWDIATEHMVNPAKGRKMV